MARKTIDRDYLYDNTIGDAENILVEGIQLVKTDNLKIKKRLDENTVIYYVKENLKNRTKLKNKKTTKSSKSKGRKNEKSR